MKKKNIKFLPILVALVSAGGFSYILDKNKSLHDNCIVLDDVDNIDNIDDIDDIYTTDISTETTMYTTTTTIATTIITTENIYKDIMFLDGIDNNYDISEINDLIIKYSAYCDFSYDQAVSILREGFNINDYNSLEDAIMRTLFDKGCELGLLSTYCDNKFKRTCEMSRDEKESIMLDMCNVMEIPNDYKKIILAVFRWETGHGESDLCRYNNNYGAIKVGNKFGIYQTPEFGMYRAILCIYNHILKSNNKGYYDINSIVSDMSYRYCYDTASDWAYHVNNMVYSVSDCYDFDSKQYIKKYEG